METMSWTDERLDNFAAETAQRSDSLELRVNERFDSVDRRFEEVDRRFAETYRRFDDVDRRFDKVDSRLERMEKRIDDLYRGLLLFGGGTLATFVVGFAGIIITQ
jgi:hypothetical protein